MHVMKYIFFVPPMKILKLHVNYARTVKKFNVGTYASTNSRSVVCQQIIAKAWAAIYGNVHIIVLNFDYL